MKYTLYDILKLPLKKDPNKFKNVKTTELISEMVRIAINYPNLTELMEGVCTGKDGIRYLILEGELTQRENRYKTPKKVLAAQKKNEIFEYIPKLRLASTSYQIRELETKLSELIENYPG